MVTTQVPIDQADRDPVQCWYLRFSDARWRAAGLTSEWYGPFSYEAGEALRDRFVITGWNVGLHHVDEYEFVKSGEEDL